MAHGSCRAPIPSSCARRRRASHTPTADLGGERHGTPLGGRADRHAAQGIPDARRRSALLERGAGVGAKARDRVAAHRDDSVVNEHDGAGWRRRSLPNEQKLLIRSRSAPMARTGWRREREGEREGRGRSGDEAQARRTRDIANGEIREGGRRCRPHTGTYPCSATPVCEAWYSAHMRLHDGGGCASLACAASAREVWREATGCLSWRSLAWPVPCS